MKAMLTLTIFEILLFKAWSVLRPAQRATGSERVNRLKVDFSHLNERFVDT